MRVGFQIGNFRFIFAYCTANFDRATVHGRPSFVEWRARDLRANCEVDEEFSVDFEQFAAEGERCEPRLGLSPVN